jgi:hypothetical protein
LKSSTDVAATLRHEGTFSPSLPFSDRRFGEETDEVGKM